MNIAKNGELHPDIEAVVRFTIRQWASLSELEMSDHDDMLNNWIQGDLKDFVKANLSNLEEQIVKLQKRDEILSRLEAAGVDNWDGYSEAFEDYDE